MREAILCKLHRRPGSLLNGQRFSSSRAKTDGWGCCCTSSTQAAFAQEGDDLAAVTV